MSSQLHKDIYGNKWRRSRQHNVESTSTKGVPYTNVKEDPDYGYSWKSQNIKDYKEAVYDKISELLIANFSKIEPYIDGDGIEALQRTYKRGKLIKGKKDSDMMVIYESDIQANIDDKDIEDMLMGWLEFTDPSLITLDIISTIPDNADVAEGSVEYQPELILRVPGKGYLNMSYLVGAMDIESLGIKDNVSQFLELKKVKTNINRAKLKEYVDTEFSELTPVTFTGLLEQYNKFKKDIPFYRYRTDDFFNEYNESNNVPIEYRIEKFFEEFEKIKGSIPAGSIAGETSLIIDLENDMFGHGTMTYLVKEARNAIGDNDVPVWSNNQVLSFTQQISDLESEVSQQTSQVQNLQLQLSLTQEQNLDNTLDILNNGASGAPQARKGGLAKNIKKMRRGGRTRPQPFRKAIRR